jgi:hypothetical protein
VIWQSNQAAQYGPATAVRSCRFEGTNQVLLNVATNASMTFDQAYGEGDWTEVTGGGMESFTWINMPAKWAAWLSDPRNIHTGILQ